jgi:hypothetical protein
VLLTDLSLCTKASAQDKRFLFLPTFKIIMLRITHLTGLTLTTLLLLILTAGAPWSTQAESDGVVDSSSSAPITETNERSLQDVVASASSSSSSSSSFSRRRCRDVRLRECDLDCNRHCDCGQGLVCYRRGLFDFKIPGCRIMPRNHNYCIDPQKFPTKTLWHIGKDGLPQPTFVFPLRECWGNCVVDKDWYVVRTFRSTD